MDYPVITSSTPVVFDALPAVKALYAAPGATAPHIYTLARFYFLGKGLQLAITVFERQPPPESQATLVLCGGSTLLSARLSPSGAWLSRLAARQGGSMDALLADESEPLACTRYAGNDEQGWYWGAQMALAGDVLENAGIGPAAPFRASLLKHQAGQLQGSLHRGLPLDTAAFPLFSAI